MAKFNLSAMLAGSDLEALGIGIGHNSEATAGPADLASIAKDVKTVGDALTLAKRLGEEARDAGNAIAQAKVRGIVGCAIAAVAGGIAQDDNESIGALVKAFTDTVSKDVVAVGVSNLKNAMLAQRAGRLLPILEAVTLAVDKAKEVKAKDKNAPTPKPVEYALRDTLVKAKADNFTPAATNRAMKETICRPKAGTSSTPATPTKPVTFSEDLSALMSRHAKDVDADTLVNAFLPMVAAQWVSLDAKGVEKATTGVAMALAASIEEARAVAEQAAKAAEKEKPTTAAAVATKGKPKKVK